MEWLLIVDVLLQFVGAALLGLAAVARLRKRGSVLHGVVRRALGRHRRPKRYESLSNSRNRKLFRPVYPQLWVILSPTPRGRLVSEQLDEEDYEENQE